MALYEPGTRLPAPRIEFGIDRVLAAGFVSATGDFLPVYKFDYNEVGQAVAQGYIIDRFPEITEYSTYCIFLLRPSTQAAFAVSYVEFCRQASYHMARRERNIFAHLGFPWR